MYDVLQDWQAVGLQDNPSIQAILIKSSKAKRPAFCAGGDVKAVYEKSDFRFFFDEYQLNHAIATSPIPIVSLWDGVVMGGGVGAYIYNTLKLLLRMPAPDIVSILDSDVRDALAILY